MACFALRVKRFTGRAKHWARDAQPIDLHDIRDPADHIAERAELSKLAERCHQGPGIQLRNGCRTGRMTSITGPRQRDPLPVTETAELRIQSRTHLNKVAPT